MFKLLSFFDSNHCLAVILCVTGQRGHSHRNSIYDDAAQILFKLYLLQYYFPPSSGLKFNSKEVFRYLDNVQNKVSIQKISPNIIVEKAIVEGLPPGWVKKTRITTNGDSVRRDTFYIDPVNGYTFCSIEDVDHYLETGKIGRNEFTSKDKDGSDMELKADKSPSRSVTMKPTLSVSKGQSSDLDMIANDQQIPRSASSEEYLDVPISECVVGAELTNLVISRAESSDQKQGKFGLAQSASVSGCTNKDVEEKQLQENSETKHGAAKAQAQDHQWQNKHKKEINLPHRASKRLAGIKVGPVPELKTRNRARRVAIKQSDKEETIIINVDKSPNSLSGDLAKQKLSGTDTEKTLEVQISDKDKKCFSFSPLENNATVEECARVLENGDKVDAKLDYTLDFPLGELLTDPCIAFAIQTLTGVTFEASKNSQTSSNLRNSQHSKTSAPTLASGKGDDKKSNDGLGDRVLSSLENLAIPKEHAGDDKTDSKAKNENAGPSSEKTLDMSWMDPCIEFAIKTLTDTIPSDSADQNPKNCIQLSSVCLDNIYQTDYSCRQYFGTQKPMFHKQSFVDPSLQHTRNIGIVNSAAEARL
ncbi:Methyl-CpG-binding domain-containing protein 13 [Glycine max]|nr:Methyl-CpG-binding domain-containing protein 13 [Glycine max]